MTELPALLAFDEVYFHDIATVAVIWMVTTFLTWMEHTEVLTSE